MGSNPLNIFNAFLNNCVLPFIIKSTLLIHMVWDVGRRCCYVRPLTISLSPRRRSVIEISRALKELFHEARERASKALGFAKMLRKVS